MTAIDGARVRTPRPPAQATAVADARTNTLAPERVSAPAIRPVELLPERANELTAPTTDTLVSPRPQPSLENRQLWERRYTRRLRWTDGLVILAVVAATALVQLAVLFPGWMTSDPWILARVPLLTAVVWLFMLAGFRTRSASVIGTGTTEYKRVAHASGLAFGLLAIVFVVFQWEGLRWQLIAALPVGLLGVLLGRWGWRKWLLRQRKFGHYASRALVVGRASDVEYVIDRLQRYGNRGYIIVGTTIEDAAKKRMRVGDHSYVVRGSLDTAAEVARDLGADTIIVASTPANDPDFVKRLSWQLEGTAAELILSSRMVDVAGPRISLRPVDGLPLISVRIPTFSGGQHLIKRAFDIVFAGAALLVIGLITPFIALAIKLDAPGPVFFRQRRIGRDGREFFMVKFRSMRVDAEEQLAVLRAANEGAGPLFKMKHDPRVTRVGRILRKFSLDELPQFWNVLVGDMSIVGPRPPLPTEVTEYDGTVSRRLYINPGITGLWQVSGRSNLSWEESVQLDLRYVENWSMTDDLRIMWRTAKVMVAPVGAY